MTGGEHKSEEDDEMENEEEEEQEEEEEEEEAPAMRLPAGRKRRKRGRLQAALLRDDDDDDDDESSEEKNRIGAGLFSSGLHHADDANDSRLPGLDSQQQHQQERLGISCSPRPVGIDDDDEHGLVNTDTDEDESRGGMDGREWGSRSRHRLNADFEVVDSDLREARGERRMVLRLLARGASAGRAGGVGPPVRPRRRHEAIKSNSDDEGEWDGLDLHGAIQSALNSHPEEVWHRARERERAAATAAIRLPPGEDVTHRSNNGTDRRAVPPLSLTSLPHACLLRITACLDPHEISDFLSSCRTLTSLVARHRLAVDRLRVASAISYFSILKPYADLVDGCVDGGWLTLALFLSEVSRRMQAVYGPVRVPKLHRTLVGEKVVGNIVGWPDWPWSTEEERASLAKERRRTRRERRKERPSFERCVGGRTRASLACDSRYGDNVLLGDVTTTYCGDGRNGLEWTEELGARLARFMEKAESPTCDLDHDGTLRVRRGLLPIIFIFETSDLCGGYQVQFGLAPPAQPCHRLGTEVFLWSLDGWCTSQRRGRTPWVAFGPGGGSLDEECCFCNPLPSLSAFFCLCPASYTASFSSGKLQPMAERELNAFAWLVAHRIAPFDAIGNNAPYWEGKIREAKSNGEDDEGGEGLRFISTQTANFSFAALRGELPLACASDYLPGC